MIAFHEIHDGDQVEISDHSGNRARGTVRISHGAGRTRLTVLIFGVACPFAEHRPSGWQRVQGNTVVWHQPALWEAEA